jgi:hypothetical protein
MHLQTSRPQRRSVVDRNDRAAIRAALRTAQSNHPIVLAVIDALQGLELRIPDPPRGSTRHLGPAVRDEIEAVALAIRSGTYEGQLSEVVRFDIEAALEQQFPLNDGPALI